MSVDFYNANAIVTCDFCKTNQEIMGALMTPKQGGFDVRILPLPRPARDADGKKKERLGRVIEDAEKWVQEGGQIAGAPARWKCPECRVQPTAQPSGVVLDVYSPQQASASPIDASGKPVVPQNQEVKMTAFPRGGR